MEDDKRRRLETKEIVIGYAMSRLNMRFQAARGVNSWRAAYSEAATALSRPERTFKNLRDEFDPFQSNNRRGWHARALRADRRRVMQDLMSISDDALLELVDRILNRDDESIVEAIDAMACEKSVAANVAERLLTGRRAEEYFLDNCRTIIEVSRTDILDLRNHACGYDFGIRKMESLAIEVKGVKDLAGPILFTDREWAEASIRENEYILVVVGNLANSPIPRVVRNPTATLQAKCSYRQSIIAEWHMHVDVR